MVHGKDQTPPFDQYPVEIGKEPVPILYVIQHQGAQDHVERARLDEIQYRKDRVRFEHYRKITDAGERLVTQSQILPMGYYVENTAARNLEGYYAKYLTGGVSFLDLISVAENEYRAQTNRLTNRYEFFEICSELLNTLGREYLYHGSGDQKAFYDELEQYLNE